MDLSIADTFGTQPAVLYTETSLSIRGMCTQLYVVETGDTALIREVSLTWSVLLWSEVSMLRTYDVRSTYVNMHVCTITGMYANKEPLHVVFFPSTSPCLESQWVRWYREIYYSVAGVAYTTV